MQIVLDVPDDVLVVSQSAPPLDTSAWDGRGIPDGAAVRMVDEMPFEGWSVAMLAEVDPTTLGEWEAGLYLAQTERAANLLAAKQDAALFRLSGARGPARGYANVDTASHELSAATRIPLGAAQRRVWTVRRLHEFLPRTRALFEQGLIGRGHVMAVVEATRDLTPPQCAEVEAGRALDHADRRSVADLRRRVRRAAAKVSPDGLRDRERAAADAADVRLEPGEDGVSDLIAKMPTVDALIVKKAADAYAMRRKAAGDDRALGVLRAEGLRVMAEAYLTGRVDGTVPTVHGRPVEVHVCATPEALAGLTDTPGEVPGVGPVPIETIREMAREAKLRWLTIDPETGRLLDYGDTTYRIPNPLAAQVNATYVGSAAPFSTVAAERCDLDHVVPAPAGSTATDNLAPIDRNWHRAKTFARVTVKRRRDGTIEWTTPLGRTVVVDPYDYRLGP